jgi:hypothetical protein
MRSIAILFALLILYIKVRAQDTTYIVTSEVNDQWTPMALVEARNQIFKLQEPVRTILKLNLTTRLAGGEQRFVDREGRTHYDTGFGLDFGVERKLSASFSLDLGMRLKLRSLNEWLTFLETRIEPRWYYNMNRNIREGKQENNVSGNYFGLEFSNTLFRNSAVDYQFGLALNYGIQRRLFNWGYFDLGYGVGVLHQPGSVFSRGGSVLFTRPRARFGLAWVRPKPGASSGGYCEALRCFREERSMWKIDLLNLLDIYADYRARSLTLNPSIAYERKIGASPFSLNTEFFGRTGLGMYEFGFNSTAEEYHYSFVTAGLNVQPRWYFNLKRRMAQGRSGNNLSGMYLALQAGSTFTRSKTEPSLFAVRALNTTHFGVAPVFGAQYRFLQNGFVDLNINTSYGASRYKETRVDGGVTRWQGPAALTTSINVKVGWAF